ncbi:MAG: C1 family peptidase [Bacteroidales bacterium]|nr:C1 family peptidase [Bacteroidales bacterium]
MNLTRNRRFIMILFLLMYYNVTEINAQLPQVYDLRMFNLVSPVKDQGSCGSCWAFATIAAIESNWLKQGHGLTILSEDNLIDCHGFDEAPCYGGSYYMSNALLSRYDGPFLISSDAYTPTLQDCPNNMTFPPQKPAYIEDMRFLPKDLQVIKQAIYDYGAVATTMFFNMSNFNMTTYKYYDNYIDANDSLYPHCVAIAGWNDTMTFPGAPGTGAWIIKDSYGTSWAQNGYFYVSYYDVGILSETVYFPIMQELPAAPAKSHVYYHDKFGWVDNFGFSTNTAYALTKYTLSPANGSIVGQQIKRIGTYAIQDNMQIHINIYGDFNGGVLSNLIASSSMLCNYKGYYTFPFNLPTDTLGTTIYIKATYTMQGTPSAVIPIEIYEASHTTGISLSTNSCFVSIDGINWASTGQGSSYNFDVCIKMYTADAPKAALMCLTDTVCEGQTVHLQNTTPMPCDSIQWFLNGMYQNAMPMINIPMLSSGVQLITLVAYFGGNSDSLTKAIYVHPLPSPPLITQSGDTLFSSQAFMYQWHDDNGIIPGANLNYYIPLSNGNYYVQIWDNNMCERYSVPYNYNVSNNNEMTSGGIAFYPNPFGEYVNIEFENPSEDTFTLEVYNIQGALVKSINNIKGKRVVFHNNDLSQGIYIFRMGNDRQGFMGRFIVK